MKLSRILSAAALLAALVPALAVAQDTASFDARYNSVLTRLQSMGCGYYTDAEWAEIDREVADISSDATSRNDGPAIVRATLVNAMVTADMRRRYPEAVSILRDGIAKADAIPGTDASPLYVKLAEVLSEAGDAPAIESLIREYKASRHYNPQPLYWSGAARPGDPLLVARPKTDASSDSIPVTVMEKALLRAKSAPGVLFPDFTLADTNGRTVTLSSLRGKIVLVDFFLPGWKLWESNRPALEELYSARRADGFEIVGISLAPRAVPPALPWPVIPGAPDLTRQLGIFGETSNFLLDRRGAVVARDLRGSGLSFTVDRLLAAKP